MITEYGKMLMKFIEFLASNEIALLIFNGICLLIWILCVIFTSKENKKKEVELQKTKAEREFYIKQLESELRSMNLLGSALRKVNEKYAPISDMKK